MRRVDFDKPVRVSWLRDLCREKRISGPAKRRMRRSRKGVVKIRCRPRVTQHGGATKTAV